MHVERVVYQAGSVQARGALVFSETSPADAPLILLSPNWLGVSEAAIEQAKEMAGDKYVLFVADMFGEGLVADGPQVAAPLADGLRQNWQERRERIGAGFDAMKKAAAAQGRNGTRTAAIGFCFGGGNVLELARAGTKLNGVVALHADLGTHAPAQQGAVAAPLLILHGSADPVAPKENRDAFEAEMTAAGAAWSMFTFGGVLHSFAEKGPPVPGIAQYDEKAARMSFRVIGHFLEDVFA